jgi:polyisoprenoid-binding protein YceI
MNNYVTFRPFLATLTLVAGMACAGIVSRASAASTGVTWTADLVHSRAEFTVSHMVVSKVWGHIPIRSILFVAPPGSAIPNRIDASLAVNYEDTDNHDRDADLRSPAYFDVQKYPGMTFRSTRIVAAGKDDFSVTGDLTIKATTKSVTFPVHIEGRIPEGAGSRVGYSASLTIDRREWGIDDKTLTPAGVLLVGYPVTIGLTLEAVAPERLP